MPWCKFDKGMLKPSLFDVMTQLEFHRFNSLIQPFRCRLVFTVNISKFQQCDIVMDATDVSYRFSDHHGSKSFVIYV